MQKLKKLISNPLKYIPLAGKIVQQRMSYLFRDASFFMQGQMDINPRSRWYSDDLASFTGGYFPKNDFKDREICNLEPWDNTRRDMLILLLRTIEEKNIAGDFAELGVYKGGTAKLIHYYAPGRKVHLFDTFEGFTERSVVAEKANTQFAISSAHFSDTSLVGVQRYVAQKNDNVAYYKGYFPESITGDVEQRSFSFVHLDADLYEPILEGLKFFYPRLSKKGIIVVHDYNGWRGARKAVDDFFADKNELPVPMPDKSGSVLIVKQ